MQGTEKDTSSETGREDSRITTAQTHDALLYQVVNFSPTPQQTQYSTSSHLTPQMQYIFPSSTAHTSFTSLLMVIMNT